MAEVSQDMFDGRVKLCDDRFKRNNERIGELESSMQNLTNLITQLTEIVKTSVSTSVDHERRVREIEMRPGKRYDSIWGYAIGALVGGVIGYFLSRIFP